MYQGHLSDGSSIQKHSAGGIFPYIVFAKQSVDKLLWGVLSPNGDERMFCKYENAHDFALAVKEHKEAKSQVEKIAIFHRIQAARLADALARLSVN